MLRITDDIAINDRELSESFARASGPGGQNVNKVNSAVTLRFEAARSPALGPAVKARLKRLAGRRWTRDGAIVLVVDTHRSQALNRTEARERLAELVRRALEAPRRRIPTRPGKAAERRRLDAKTRRARIKAARRPPQPD